jgi:hypothetical protein
MIILYHFGLGLEIVKDSRLGLALGLVSCGLDYNTVFRTLAHTVFRTPS